MTDRVVAVSLDRDELLAIRASRDAEGLRVESAARLNVPADPDGRMEVRSELGRLGLLDHPTVLVAPSGGAFVCFHRPRVQDGKALRETIRYGIEDTLPVPMDGMAVDFDYLADGGGGRPEVLAAAVPEDELKAELETLEGIGLIPTQVTIGGAALGNAYGMLGLAEGERRMLGIHFAASGIDLVRLKGRTVEEMRSIATAGDEEGPGEGLPVLLRSSVLEAALNGDLDAVYVSGRPEKARKATDRLRDELSVPVRGADLTQADVSGLPDGQADLLRGDGLPLLGAAGEALGLGAPLSLNLMGSRQQRAGWLDHLGTPLRTIAVLLAAVLLLWVASGLALLWRARGETETAASELASLWGGLHPGEALPLDPVRTLRGERAGAGSGGVPADFAILGKLRRLAQSRGNAAYRRLRIAGGEVSVEGDAADYAAVDALVARLSDTGGFEPGAPEMSGGSGGVRFRAELREPDHD